MTEAEIREYIKKECPQITDEFIDDFCATHDISIQQYKQQFDRALAARRKSNPNYPNMIDGSKRKWDL